MLSGTIALFFSPLTSIVGHFCVSEDPGRKEAYFYHFYYMNFILGVVFFLGYFSVADSLIYHLFGSGLELSRPVVFIITLNSFLSYMGNTALLFRNASGAFYHDRWKAMVEGIINIILSLLFVHVFPVQYRVVGVIAATIITTLLINFTVEPYVVFRHVFGKHPGIFYFRNYAYSGLFTFCLFLLSKFLTTESIVRDGMISIGVSAAALGFLALLDRKFRSELQILARVFTKQADRIIQRQ